MEKKKTTNVILKMTRSIGNQSTKNCWGWFCQPKVPVSMKKKKSSTIYAKN